MVLSTGAGIWFSIAEQFRRRCIFCGHTLPDPNQAFFCYDLDCFQAHAFLWKKGAMTDLGTLPGNNNSAAGSINSHGWITGQSQRSVIDPNVGIPEFRAVLWRDNQITDLGTLSGGTQALGIFTNRRRSSGRVLRQTASRI